MADWIKPTLTLCTYGFFKDMKPSEAFLTPYLTSPYKNITKKVVSDEIYPVSTYSYFLFLFLVLMTTDFLRYKPLVILESLAYLATRVILVWGKSIFIMQMMQITYGLAMATEIAYYSYIYAMVPEEHFQTVTSYTRLAVLLGKGIGDLTGQILVSTHATNLLVLNCVSLGSVTVAVIVSFFLPKVTGAVFGGQFERFSNDDETSNDEEVSPRNRGVICCISSKNYFKKLWLSFKTHYSSKRLLKWSFWWALSMCGGLQVEDYAMNLWSDLQGSGADKTYNGAVFAAGTLLSALFVFLFSFCKIQGRNVLAELTIGGLSVLQGVVIATMGLSQNLIFAYIGYVIFRVSFAFCITVASYEIATELEGEGYGLIFGWNTLVAVGLQSLLTLAVADKRGLDLDMKTQFLIYGIYFGCIALIFLARPIYVGVRNLCRICCRKSMSTRCSTDNEHIENRPV